MKNGVDFHSSVDCQRAFEKLKSCPFWHIHVLVRIKNLYLRRMPVEKVLVHPVAYASRSLNPHEKNYAISELETLALVWAVKQFRAYILGHKCTVLTDHSTSTSLLNTPHPSAKLDRWAIIIQQMDLHIQYRAGKSNASAHALSRNPSSPTETARHK